MSLGYVTFTSPSTSTSTPANDFTLRDEVLDEQPIIRHVTDLLGLDESLGVHVMARDARTRLAPTRSPSLMVANLALHHVSLYAISEWASTLDAGLVGLAPSELELLNDDRMGRALAGLTEFVGIFGPPARNHPWSPGRDWSEMLKSVGTRILD